MTTQTGNARRSAAEINDNGAAGRDGDGFLFLSNVILTCDLKD